jgi:hypothetical protein
VGHVLCRVARIWSRNAALAMQYYIANAQHSCRPQRKSVAATKSGREWSFPIEVVSECTAQLGSDDEWRVMGDVCLTFLGTSAGGPPSKHRSFSSVALRTANGDLLLFDCGEGTQRQLIFGYARLTFSIGLWRALRLISRCFSLTAGALCGLGSSVPSSSPISMATMYTVSSRS